MTRRKSEPKEHYVYPPILQRAREMRHPLTPAEAKVWAGVRNQQLGFKIRRQHPIAHFIADFNCAKARLVIEIDGDTHAEPDQAEYDAARTQWLEERGYRVIRFHNNDVHVNIDGVLAALKTACEG
ncbi:MAG: endonuclease domain-containing protein [Anaerolineales bacterium]